MNLYPYRFEKRIVIKEVDEPFLFKKNFRLANTKNRRRVYFIGVAI